mgnify:FL=1
MRVSIEAWGLSMELFGLVTHLYPGDVYFRVPWIGELAWNSTGLHVNRPLRSQ